MENPQRAPAPVEPYMRPSERTELQADIEAIESQLSDRHPGARLEDRPEAVRRLKRMKAELERRQPPRLSGPEKDEAAREAVALTEYLSSKMLSYDEMRKNPPGSVGKNTAYHKQTKNAQLRLKALRQELEPDSDDPDVANLETIRPISNRNISFDGSQIGGERIFSVPSESYKQGYDNIDWEKTRELIEKQSGVIEQQDEVIQKLEAKLESLESRVKTRPAAVKAEVQASTPRRRGRIWTEEQREEASRKAKQRLAERKAKEAAKAADAEAEAG